MDDSVSRGMKLLGKMLSSRPIFIGEKNQSPNSILADFFKTSSTFFNRVGLKICALRSLKTSIILGFVNCQFEIKKIKNEKLN